MSTPMQDPLAFFLTWTTYGTHLPGDARGWVGKPAKGIYEPRPHLEKDCRARLVHPPILLTAEERNIAEATIRHHCEIRSWPLHAINVRTNHVHIVVTAKIDPDGVAEQFKA